MQNQIASLPKPSNDSKAAKNLSQALDDHIDREKCKANLVIHNLPEQEGSSVFERSQKDIALFMSMIKDVIKISYQIISQ